MNIDRRISSKPRTKKNDEVMKPLLDINTLDYYCRYIISNNKNIRVSGLNLVKDLFSRIDSSMYNDPERVTRIEFIKRGLDARLVRKLNEKKLIISYINGGIIDKPLLDTDSMEEVSDEVLAYLNEQAAELAKSYFVDDKYEQILSLSTDLKNGNYSRRSDVVHKIQNLTSELNMQFNKMDDSINSDPMVTLIPGEFENVMSDIYSRETSSSRILKTGMIGLNTMLDGGFQGCRVYLILALAAGGKSFTMLDLAIQIKKYNTNYKPHDPTKIPTIVFLTMENSKDENMSRIMSMGTAGKTFADYDMEESFEVLRSNGLGYDPETDPIDIVMVYKPNLSVNVDYMYTLVDKLRESGREPICFFQDHIKRIRPVNRYNDLRLDLGEVINEFKSFANDTGIPVITDSHLNRDASRVLDDSSGNSNKKDLIRNLGSFNVSESYLMIDNTDVGIIINKETDSNDCNYMGFKCIKTRTKCDLDLFYQPYIPDNPIKLQEDLHERVPMFKRTMKETCNNGISVQRNVYSCQYGSNMNSSSHRDEDESLFSSDNMAEAIPIDSANILLPDNMNQTMFHTIGVPSIPVYDNIIMQPTQYQPSDWEIQLNKMKSSPDMRMAIYFMDDNGLCIRDGAEY